MKITTIIMICVFAILGIIDIILFIVGHKKYEYVQFLNDNVTSLEADQIKRELEIQELKTQNFRLQTNNSALEDQIANKQKHFTDLSENVKTMRESIDEEIETYKKQAYEIMQSEFESSAEKEAAQFEELHNNYLQTYEECLAESAKYFQQQAESYNITIEELQLALADWQSKVNAAVATFSKALMESEEREFYRIQLSEIDKNEIKELRSIMHLLRNPEPLNKVIYKVYYENPANDMIKRVAGGHTSGIYKITNLINNKCYIGQSVEYWPVKNFSYQLVGVY